MYKNNLEGFPCRLRQSLKAKKMTQVKLAKQAKMSKHSITKYLKRTRAPSPKSAANLAEALGVDAAWLLYGQGHLKTVAREDGVFLKGIPDNISFDRMHDILEEFATHTDPGVRLQAAKIFKQAFEDFYIKVNENDPKYFR